MLDGSVILVTGGTGSFGRTFAAQTLKRYNPAKIIIYSRDEMKQWEMAGEFDGEGRLRFFLGDVRDRERLRRACAEVDYIVHAAAGKIVPTAEYNPFEYIKTNVVGAMNLIDCAIDCGVKRVIALSTDKACNPVNLYGATKLCADKLFIAGNNYCGSRQTRFAVVRYGNVMGSRGSIIPFFMKQARGGGELTITDTRMTRFLLPLNKAVELVWHALAASQGGEIFVRKCPSMKITDVARAIAPGAAQRVVGIRPGEKLHELMISAEDGTHTRHYDTHYTIMPEITMPAPPDHTVDPGDPVPEGFCYTSAHNDTWMSVGELQEWLRTTYGWEGP